MFEVPNEYHQSRWWLHIHLTWLRAVGHPLGTLINHGGQRLFFWEDVRQFYTYDVVQGVRECLLKCHLFFLSGWIIIWWIMIIIIGFSFIRPLSIKNLNASLRENWSNWSCVDDKCTDWQTQLCKSHSPNEQNELALLYSFTMRAAFGGSHKNYIWYLKKRGSQCPNTRPLSSQSHCQSWYCINNTSISLGFASTLP